MADNAAFAAKLKQLRKRSGMTQQELADASGVSIGGLRDLEQKKNGPTVDTVKKLAAALRVPEAELLIGSDTPMPPQIGRPPKQEPAKIDPVSTISLAGAVAAGPGSLEEFQDEFIDVTSFYVGCVAYLVRGNSMVDSNIASGDFVIVRASPSAEIGEVVVAWKEGQGAMVKKLGARGMLLSCDSSRDKYKLDEDAGDRILGVLVGVVRKC